MVARRRTNPRIRALVSLIAVGLMMAGCQSIAVEEPSQLDDGLIAQASADGFRLRHPGGDVDFVVGIDVGSALPGHWPGELAITAETWRRWFPMMAATGAHAIRIYTVQMPAFYQEFAAYNQANPDDPLYLLHGVWIPEDLLAEGRDLFAADVLEQARTDIDDAVAVVHGDAVLPERHGYATGTFDVDVSPWVMGWAYGVEMDPYIVDENDERHRGRTYEGRYITATPEATATEVWLAEMLDRVAAREAERGRTVPLTISNWPTTDPLDHPTEPLDSEELVGIDMNHIPATEEWPAGTFANYHAYPYYPDFQRYEPGIVDYRYGSQIDPYAGYLVKLRDHHAAAGIPLMVLEFGLPTSIGSAHHGSLGRDQGGHNEADAMAFVGDMLRTQHDLGLSGGFVFAWHDEWFKRTWNTMDTELPPNRRQLWLNPLTNESSFGLVAIEPGSAPSPIVIDGRGEDWTQGNSEVIYRAERAAGRGATGATGDVSGVAGVSEVRARHDAAYLYLRVMLDQPDRWLDDPVAIGFDLVNGGNTLAPFSDADLDDRFDTAIVIGSGTGPSGEEDPLASGEDQAIEGRRTPQAEAFVRASNDYQAIVLGWGLGYFEVNPADIEPDSGVWNPQRLIVNRPLYVPGQGRQPTEWFDLNPLVTGSTDPASPDFDSRTLWAADGRVIELRVPWAMVGFTDPSSLNALVVYSDEKFGGEPVVEVGVGVAVGDAGIDTDPYRWSGWDRVEWHERLKAGVEHFTQAAADVND